MIPSLPKGFSHPMQSGAGAFATVYRVRQVALDRWVAIKIIKEPTAAKRHTLLQEARIQAQLHTSCVPQIYDAFEWRKKVCLVMQWIRGVSLATLLRQPLTEKERTVLATGVIGALATMHAQGFVHRDLKPENIIISPTHGVYLVDFGLSRSVAAATASAVATVRGTPAYMAPELWGCGSGVDLMRADVFALGKVLQEIFLPLPAVEQWFFSLVAVNPESRPATAEVVLASDAVQQLLVLGSPNWQQLAQVSTAEQVSNDLATAAKQLLAARRNDEAYWLLIESVEENSNNSEAVAMISTFGAQTRKQFTLLHYAFFLLFVAGGVVSVFFAGKQRTRVLTEVSENAPVQQRIATVNKYDAISTSSSVFREDSLATDQLAGTLVLGGLPPAVVVVVDNKPIEFDVVARKGIPLRWGEHELAVVDAKGRVCWRETFHVLPFENKQIVFAPGVLVKEF